MSEHEAIVENRWRDEEAEGLSDLDLLVYQSRLVGGDPRLVVWGGGNTSLKTREVDFRGRPVDVLRVKGSGSDLKAVVPRDFPGVRLDDVLPLMSRDDMSDEEMVAYLGQTLVEPNAPRPSIETLLHAFVPARSVVHSHADAILALTNNTRSDELLKAVYGDELAVIPYRRPGFLLSKWVGETAQKMPNIKGVVLLNHGLITWHDDPKEAYRLHIEMVERATRYAEERDEGRRTKDEGSSEPSSSVLRPPSAQRREIASRIAPVLRGVLGAHGRVIVRFDDSGEVLRFVSRESVPPDRLPGVLAQGAATPDHILNTKRTALWIGDEGWRIEDEGRRTKDEGEEGRVKTPSSIVHRPSSFVLRRYEAWVREYEEYYRAHTAGEAMLPPVPRVVLVEGVGMFSVGKDSRAATISNDIYRHTIEIVEAAERVGKYRSLPLREAFEAEYWPLELYKLTLAPPEKELSRRVALITGAAGAIGAGIARRFAQEGAHVVCADLDLERAQALAEELTKANPSNRSIAVRMDVTDEGSVREGFVRAVLEYGGVDVLVSNAGVAKGAAIDELTLEEWERNFAVNARGHFLVVREALKIMKAQGTGGSVVFIATKNVVAPGKDFAAYSASKAAEAQLARVLALEGAPFGIRSNMVNPDAVFGESGVWTPELRAARAQAQGIKPEDLEEHYRLRNLLQVEVTADDVAQAALFLASDRSAKTTGTMLPVDGGLREAFPR
jgi:rhamnulose-1-phosphate aldolase/alcohol dehydrogenase